MPPPSIIAPKKPFLIKKRPSRKHGISNRRKVTMFRNKIYKKSKIRLPLCPILFL
ncbi:MAG: hypothetical protein RL757_657 [Bacteroidota bacterium]|jgi:hypothetical protein